MTSLSTHTFCPVKEATSKVNSSFFAGVFFFFFSLLREPFNPNLNWAESEILIFAPTSKTAFAAFTLNLLAASETSHSVYFSISMSLKKSTTSFDSLLSHFNEFSFSSPNVFLAAQWCSGAGDACLLLKASRPSSAPAHILPCGFDFMVQEGTSLLDSFVVCCCSCYCN